MAVPPIVSQGTSNRFSFPPGGEILLRTLSPWGAMTFADQWLSGWWLSPTPLKNDGVRQLGWWIIPNVMGKIKHVPNHQPALKYFKGTCTCSNLKLLEMRISQLTSPDFEAVFPWFFSPGMASMLNLNFGGKGSLLGSLVAQVRRLPFAKWVWFYQFYPVLPYV